jgi:hypothetical protein
MEFRQHRDNGDKKPTRYYSSRQENKVAKDVGGKTTANSGATMFDKGDLKTDQFLIECKTKTSNSDSISIKKEWLDKLKDESLFMKKKYEALIFNFGPDSKNYAIIDLELFNILQEYLKSMED